MKILYLCGLYSEELLPLFYKYIKNTRLQDAANIYQYAVLEGLAENDVDFYVLSFPFLPCFPHHFTRIRVPEGQVLYGGMMVGKSVAYSSLPLFKPYSIKKNVKQSVEIWIQNSIKDKEPFVVLTYSYIYSFIEPLRVLKAKYSNMRIASIITDLPDDAMSFNTNRSLLKKIQIRYAQTRMRNSIKEIDKFILLTPYMEEKLPETIAKNIVIEGIYHNSDNVVSDTYLPKTLLYTGTFQEFSGVRLLTDAFMATSDPAFRLILCGNGPSSDYIEACAAVDSRIECRGRVSREEAVRLQKSVSLLINPRQPNGGITRYSFPSKTMEYLSSGTPMIGYRLEGIPDEYFKFMSVPEDLTEEALTRTIERELSLSEIALSKKGIEARKFILGKKTAKIQIARLIDFITSEY